MCSFQLLSAVLLVVFLHVRTSIAQDPGNWYVLKMDLEVPESANASEIVSVELGLDTGLDECMVVTASLQSDKPLEGNADYKFTGCLCKDYPRKFFWDVATNSTVIIGAVVDVVPEMNICPENRAVIPIEGNRFAVAKTLNIIPS